MIDWLCFLVVNENNLIVLKCVLVFVSYLANYLMTATYQASPDCHICN